jgi:uncharacterized membrane protein YfcA
MESVSLPIFDIVVLALAAYGTATLSAVIGMGGGLVLLAVMTLFLPPVAVVPLHAVIQLGSNTTRTLIFLGHVRWRIFFIYVPFLLVGVAAATAVWTGAILGWFKPLIGVFILCFLAWRWWAPKFRTPPLWVFAPLGVVTGFISLFVGATGPFMAPFFLRDDLVKEEIIATKAACQLVLHFLKIGAFLTLGFAFAEHIPTLAILLVMVIGGAMTGKRLLSHLRQETFVRIFIAVLVLMAIQLIGQWLLG